MWRPSRANRLLPLALILAIGLRFLCPPGWMPNPAGMVPPFVLCPSENDAAAMPAMPGMAIHDGVPAPAHGKTQQDHCVPGAWVMGKAAEAPAIGAPVAFDAVLIADEARPSAPTRPARHRPQAPRAPPPLA